MTTPRQPGWYDDPQDANAQRYWDGQDWTPHRQRKPVAPQAQEPVKSTPPPPTHVERAATAPTAHVERAAAAHCAAEQVTRQQSGFVLAGLALVLVIAALVGGRVALGTFLPGILLVAAIAIIGVIFTLRSHQSGLRKAVVVTAIVLVVAAAVPASLKVPTPSTTTSSRKGPLRPSEGEWRLWLGGRGTLKRFRGTGTEVGHISSIG